jgi:hypothetical protein
MVCAQGGNRSVPTDTDPTQLLYDRLKKSVRSYVSAQHHRADATLVFAVALIEPSGIQIVSEIICERAQASTCRIREIVMSISRMRDLILADPTGDAFKQSQFS